MSRRCMLLLVLLLASISCAPLQYREAPRVSVADLRLTGVTIFEQNYLVLLRIQNPNRNGIPVSGLSFELELNGEHFASGVSNQQVTVPGLGSEIYAVNTTSNLLSIFRQLSAMQQGKSPTVTYRLQGKIHLAGASLPATLPFDNAGEISLADLGQPPPARYPGRP